MKRLQVKYCKGEQELNDFLMTLEVGLGGAGKPCLHAISYVAEVQGHGSDYETENGTKTEINMGSKIVAAVQYFVQIDEESHE